jgi:hypothetical protein
MLPCAYNAAEVIKKTEPESRQRRRLSRELRKGEKKKKNYDKFLQVHLIVVGVRMRDEMGVAKLQPSLFSVVVDCVSPMICAIV